MIYEEYRHRAGEIISGTVKRIHPRPHIVVDLGKVEAILPERNYPKLERYNVGEKSKLFFRSARHQIAAALKVILTRSHPEFVEQLFIQEVPEVARQNGRH